jgi:hypothetical protein
MEVAVNTNSGGNRLETDDSLLGGGGSSGAGRNFSLSLKRVVDDEMKDMLVGMPAMTTNVALEVVRLLKSSKALESETTANLVVNVDGLRTETEVFNCVGFNIGKTRRGSLSFIALGVTKVAASGRVLDTIACNLY